jgi:hypothetical protein
MPKRNLVTDLNIVKATIPVKKLVTWKPYTQPRLFRQG